MGEFDIKAAETGGHFQHFHLGFFVDFLYVFFADAEEGEGLFRGAPEVRGASDVEVGPEEVEFIIEGLENCPVMHFFEFDIIFFFFSKLNIGLFVVGVEEIV